VKNAKLGSTRENMMKHFAIFWAVATATIVSFGGGAYAITATDLVGTWVFKAEANGPFGAHPAGMLIFDTGGRFMQMITRTDLPKYAANKREEATPEEFKATALGSIAFFGTFSVNGTTLSRHVEAGSYPNMVGADQALGDLTLSGDELTWTNPTSPITGGKVIVSWKKAK
jgi:hypothetical protein